MCLFRKLLIPLSAALVLTAAPCAADDDAAGVTVQPVSSAPALGRLHVLDPVPALFTGPEAGSALGAVAVPGGSLAELATGRAGIAQPQRVSRRAAQPAGDESAAPGRAPSGGAVLLCGLAVVVFVAYRKLSFRA